MSDSVMVNFPLDQELKENVDEICSQMGMNLVTALTIFCKALEKERRIPFEITADTDPFFQPANIRHIRRKVEDYHAGRLKLEDHDLIEAD